MMGWSLVWMLISHQVLVVSGGETLRYHVPDTLQEIPDSFLQKTGHILLDSAKHVIAETLIVSSNIPNKEKRSPIRTDRLSVLVFLILFGGVYFWQVQRARRGITPWLRPIAGLQALDDAVGRSTEMGRPVLFIPGMADIDSLATIAALSVLKYVGK